MLSKTCNTANNKCQSQSSCMIDLRLLTTVTSRVFGFSCEMNLPPTERLVLLVNLLTGCTLQLPASRTSCQTPKAPSHVGAATAGHTVTSVIMMLDCRFVNCQAAKWQFRAGQIEQAEKTAAMFTKDGDQANNLHDMQCMWYEIECGRAHLQRHNLGKVRYSIQGVSTSRGYLTGGSF